MNLSDIGPVVLVGAGKMGMALARGWIAGGLPPDRLVLCDTAATDAAALFADEHKIRLVKSPLAVLTHVLVLAVKPQVMNQVLAEIRPVVGPHTLVISIAAGISLEALSRGLGTDRVVRTMPNTPAQVGKGVTGAVALIVSDTDRDTTAALLGAAGELIWFKEEDKLDAVTAVSGSGPAYVFYLVEALAAAAVGQGLDEPTAMKLARKTVVGAAALMEADAASVVQLRQNVTSPNGTTAAALSVLMGSDGLQPLMDKAVDAARKRSEELGRG